MVYGGAPSWVYKREMALREISHDSTVNQLLKKTDELEKQNKELIEENQRLKERIKELEKEKDVKE